MFLCVSGPDLGHEIVEAGKPSKRISSLMCLAQLQRISVRPILNFESSIFNMTFILMFFL